MKLLQFDQYYEGNFGDLEGPITYTIGIYDNDEDLNAAKSASAYEEATFNAQFGGPVKDEFIVTELTLNKITNS